MYVFRQFKQPEIVRESFILLENHFHRKRVRVPE
jgi:hypothetical protein